jgi:pyruvate dehydrogenase E1 component
MAFLAASISCRSISRQSRNPVRLVRAGSSLADPRQHVARPSDLQLDELQELEKKTIWLSSFMIHNANAIRPKRDGIKVGGHQASCSSMATIMSALYFHVLQPQDRVAVKPHASPLFHAVQYLLGNQTREQIELFRSFGGVQSYPSRTKDKTDVDFSTGSVGLGAAITTFAAHIQDYLLLKGYSLPLIPTGSRPGRMVALVGDAELDEGNVYEALMESVRLKARNNWSDSLQPTDCGGKSFDCFLRVCRSQELCEEFEGCAQVGSGL